MLRVLRGRSFLTASLFIWASWSAAADLPAPLIAALQQANIPESAVAVYVQDVTQPTPILAHNAEQGMNPASVIKLLTTYAALSSLGPAYQWQTELYTRGTLRGDKLTGDLIFKGQGDPKITLEAFWLTLRDLRARGLREIRGDLVLDRTYFDIPRGDPGAFDGAPYKPYNALPDALLLNFRSHRLRLLPDAERQRLRIEFEVAIPGARILNQVRLVDGPCADWKAALSYSLQKTSGGWLLPIAGTYSFDCGEKSLHLALLDPNDYFAALFKPLWQELGGRWHGKVVDGATPPDARLLARHTSPQLAEVVRDINKFSNNVMARQLYLTLGAEILGAPATLDKSRQAVDYWLASKGLTFLELNMDNGSGLSRSTRISARHLGDVLRSAFYSPVFAELESSLSIVSVDGTLKKHLKDSGVAGHAHLKSGSLDGVRSMAGYVLDARGRRVVLVCLINDPQSEQARPVLDALLEWTFNRP